MTGFVRVEGVVEASPRGAVLRLADGDIWRLSGKQNLDGWIGQGVVVEGKPRGRTIEAYYVAAANSA